MKDAPFDQILVPLNYLFYYLKSFFFVDCGFVGNELKQISVGAILSHDIVELLSFINIIEFDDIRVAEGLMNFDLIFQHGHVRGFKFFQVDNFDGKYLCIIFYVDCLVNFARESFS